MVIMFSIFLEVPCGLPVAHRTKSSVHMYERRMGILCGQEVPWYEREPGASAAQIVSESLGSRGAGMGRGTRGRTQGGVG